MSKPTHTGRTIQTVDDPPRWWGLTTPPPPGYADHDPKQWADWQEWKQKRARSIAFRGISAESAALIVGLDAVHAALEKGGAE